MDTESRAGSGRGTPDTHDEERDRRRRNTIEIRLPEIDSNLRDLLLDMLPGRRLMRVLSNPPDEFVAHSRNARRERLLAVRSFIDALIEDTDEAPRRGGRAREIEVE